MSLLPKIVDDKEELGRGIFDSRRAKKAASGIILPNIFKERDGVREISVDRLSFGHHAQISKVHDTERFNQTFYGWAVLAAKEAAEQGRSVVASPVQDNPYHAEIVLPDAGRDDPVDDQNAHALSLAMRAKWMPRP